MKKRLYILLSVVLFSLLTTNSVMANYSSVPGIDFAAHPSQASKIDHSITSYFLDEGAPGQILSEVLTVSNNSKKPIVIHTKCVEAKNGINGGIVYMNEPATNAWITDLPEKITLSPDEIRNINFHIKIPADTLSGDYICGLVLQDHLPQTMGDVNSSQMSISINKQVNRIIGVHVKVPGAAKYKLAIDKAEAKCMASGTYLTIKGMNQSNVLINIGGEITLYQRDKKVWSTMLATEKFLANQPIEFQFPWVGGAPKIGDYQVTVDMKGDHIGNIKKELRFSITDTFLRKYDSLSGLKTVQPYIPSWIYWIGGLLIIVLLILLRSFLNTRKKIKRQLRFSSRYRKI